MSKLTPDILFLDEAHEFSISTEMLAMIARHHARAMKIVIMSATHDPDLLREYFKDISSDIPLIGIPGRTFGVTSNFDAENTLIDDLKTAIAAGKNVLVFAPGKKEIQRYQELFKLLFPSNVEIFPLHSEVSSRDQNFLLTKTSRIPRIVIATNMAEASITLPYIDVVLDLGTQKTLRYDGHGIPTLGLENTAHSNSVQRAGRAGRTKPWTYNRYNDTPSEDLDLYPESPMEREMIDRYILTLLWQGIDIIGMIYEAEKTGKSPFFHHANLALLPISLDRLKSIGALTADNRLTVLGYELLKFPVDVYHARMLYEANERGCLDNMIPMVSILEKKWFVSKGKDWESLLMHEIYTSDLDAYIELLAIVTNTSITKKQKDILLACGISIDELRDFEDRAGSMKLYEVVDLAKIGIKNKKVKEIDELRDILLNSFNARWIEVQSSDDARSRLLSLTSGYMHYRYVYGKDRKQFFNPKHGEYASRFKQGDVSVVEPVDKWHYLGSPFIITSDDGLPDLNLLTGIIAVNNTVIADAAASNARYATEVYRAPRVSKASSNIASKDDVQPVWNLEDTTDVHTSISTITNTVTWIVVPQTWGTRPRRTTSILFGDIVPVYESAITEFHATRHKSSENAQDFYLKYCLVPFLFEYNSAVRKYIDGKDQEWIQFFAESLKRLIGKHDLYRINPDNIPRTESSFRHDSSIIDRFQESPDVIIRDFRLHGVPKMKTLTFIDIPEEGTIDKKELLELFALRNEYARYIWQLRQYTRNIPIATIEKMILARIIDEAGHVRAWDDTNAAYATIKNIMDYIATEYTEPEIRELAISVKWIWARRTEHHKYSVKLGKLQEFNTLFTNSALWRETKDRLLDGMNNGYFGDMSKVEKLAYKLFIENMTSHDMPKWDINKDMEFKRLQELLVAHITEIEQKKMDIESKIGLDDNPIAKSILDNLWLLAKTLFDDAYITSIVDPKLYKMMRTIQRDSITENTWLNSLLVDGFYQDQIGQHMKWISGTFNELVTHDDWQYQLDTYVAWWSIYKAVLNWVDPAELTKYVFDIKTLVQNLSQSARKVDNNQLWKLYRNNAA